MKMRLRQAAGSAVALGLTLATLAACGAPSSPTAAQPRPTATSAPAVLPTATSAAATRPTVPPTMAPPLPRPTERIVTTPASVEKTLYVGPVMRDCVGVAPMKCYMVREDPNGPWTNFFNTIQGFSFEPGYNYTLRVRVTDAPQPIPADASSKVYTLLEVVSKTPAPVTSPETSLAGTAWTLTAMAGQPPVSSPSPVTIEFGLDGRVSGSAGCNRYSATYTEEAGKLQVGQGASTRMMCPAPGVMEQEATYLKALAGTLAFARDGDRLTLKAAEGMTLVFTKS